MKTPLAGFSALLHGAAGLAFSTSLPAITIPVPNGSFESPATATFAAIPNDVANVTGAWESSGVGFRAVFRPELYPGGLGCAPEGLHGLTAATLSDSGIFQDCAPFDGSGNPDLYWQAGMTYTLTAAISVRPDDTAPEVGRTLNLRFFFRNADQGGATQLANKTITAGTPAINNWALTDHTVRHTVQPGAPEVGKPIGLWFITGGGTGDWTIDQLRLSAVETSGIPANPMLAHWPMNQSSGNAVSATPEPTLSGIFGNNLAGNPTLAWAPEEGLGGALRLSAPTDRVEVPAPDFTNGFTVMGWIKPDAGALTPWARFISNQFTNGFFLGRNDNTSQWRLIVNGSLGVGTMTGGSIVPGVWQHLCATYNGTTARLFVNGVEVASQNVAPPSALTQPLFFGSENTADRAIPGLIDEMKAFSGALPPAEIAALYSSESQLILGDTGYDSWASSHGIDPGGTNGLPGDDYDGDGTANEVERALGLLPADSSSRFAITTSGTAATGITLTWPSRPNLNFTVKSSGDLGDWSFTEAIVPAAPSPATATSWETGPIAPGTRKFHRVEVTP